MNTIVVSGATGVLGRSLLDHLLSTRLLSTRIIATFHHAVPLRYTHVEWIHFDLKKPAPVLKRLGSLDTTSLCFFHLACTLINAADKAWPSDVNGTLKIAKGMRSMMLPASFVFASSVSAAEGKTEYGLLKRVVEDELRGLQTDCFRTTSVRIPAIRTQQQVREFPSWFLSQCN